MSSTIELKENDVVLCTVARIEGTGVFVKLDEYKLDGAITLSEISPGRIRNIREFVSIGKKIVCKVLRKKEDHLELSLRRVSAKERDSILEYYKRERIFSSILKSVIGEKSTEVVKKIKDSEDLSQIVETVKSNPEVLKKYLSQKELDKLKEILSQKKDTEKVVQKKILIKSDQENGIINIKNVLETKEADISYLGSSSFLIKVRGKEYKTANIQLDKLLDSIKEKAKKAHAHLEIK